MNTQELLRNHCPNIPFLRRYVAKWRIGKLDKHVMPKADIKKGLSSEKERQDIVDQYNEKWPSYYREALENIEYLIANAPCYKDRTDTEKLKTNMLFYRYAFGFRPYEYLCFELEQKKLKECLEYVSDIERIRFDCKMSDMADSKVYKDKVQTYAKFKKYYKRDAVGISRSSDLKKFLAFTDKHPVFVKKEVFESCGNSVELIDINAVSMSKEEYFNSLIKKGKHILEQRIKQSKVLSELNSSTVNTIRCITFNTNDGIIVPYCFMKIGRQGSFVDNGGAGGILVGSDTQTGVLNTDGVDELGRWYSEHPDNHLHFKGFQLPDFEDLKKLCVELSSQTPTVGYIGWDFAHTEEGWVIVEGNNCGQMIGPQMTQRRGIKKEVLEIMSNMKLLVR